MIENKKEKIERLKKELAEAEAMPDVELVVGEKYLVWDETYTAWLLASYAGGQKMGINRFIILDKDKIGIGCKPIYSIYEPLPRPELGWVLRRIRNREVDLFDSNNNHFGAVDEGDQFVKDLCKFAGIRPEDITEEGVEI